MSDLAQRLRNRLGFTEKDLDEAADKLERLQSDLAAMTAERDALRAALRA